MCRCAASVVVVLWSDEGREGDKGRGGVHVLVMEIWKFEVVSWLGWSRLSRPSSSKTNSYKVSMAQCTGGTSGGDLGDTLSGPTNAFDRRGSDASGCPRDCGRWGALGGVAAMENGAEGIGVLLPERRHPPSPMAATAHPTTTTLERVLTHASPQHVDQQPHRDLPPTFIVPLPPPNDPPAPSLRLVPPFALPLSLPFPRPHFPRTAPPAPRPCLC